MRSNRRPPSVRRVSRVDFLEARRLFATIVVNSINDIVYPANSGLISLRNAVATADAASSATTIDFDPTVFASAQTITLATGEQSISVDGTNPITINGPTSQLTLKGGTHPLLSVDGGTASISGVTMTSTGSEALYQQDGALTLTNVVIENAANSDGFDIYNSTVPTQLTDCTISGNGRYGIHGSPVELTGSTLSDNTEGGITGGSDGGITAPSGQLTLTDDTITGNTGPGIATSSGSGPVVVTNSTISDNSASKGAGIYLGGASTCTVTDSTISGNTATGVGAGVYVSAYGGNSESLSIVNTTITGNSAAGNGGGIEIDDTTSILDSTIAGNTAGGLGGGVSTTVTQDAMIGNTIIATNTATQTATSDDVNNDVTSQGHNLIGVTAGSAWLTSDITGTSANPVSPDLGALANNGGPTETLLPGAGSPAIDAGSNALIPTGITTDQRGLARIYNTTVDIGSVETQAGVVATPPPNQSTSLFLDKSFLLGSFNELSAAGPYTVTVNWGDGTANTVLSVPATGTNPITIPSQSHEYAAAGMDTVTVTVADAAGTATNSATFTVTVGSGGIQVTPPAAQSADLNTSKTFNLGSFTAEDAVAPYTIDVNWGDGTSNTTFTTSTTGTIPGQTHTYTNTGQDPVIVTITDASGNVTNNFTFVVTTIAATLSISAPSAQTSLVGVDTTYNLGSFSETGGTAPYTISVAWGDGSTDTTFTMTGPGSITSQSHPYFVAGAETATVTVTDASGALTGSASFGVTVTAGAQTSSVAVQSSSVSILSGQSTTITAMVTPATATGYVVFEQNGTAIGSPVAVVNGVAVLTTTALVPGSVEISANYGGSATYENSVSSGVTVTVAPPPSTTTITVQASSTTLNTSDSVTLTATVTPSTNDGVAATGTVTFYQGTTVLGTATVEAGGVATLITTTSLPVGTVSITATYSGDNSFDATSTSVAVNVTVVPTPTTTAVSLSGTSKTLSQYGTFTASINPGVITSSTLASVPIGGEVTFTVDGTVIGTTPVGENGVATLTTNTALPQGIDVVVATYAGNGSFGSSFSSETEITVTADALVPVVTAAKLPTSIIAGVSTRGLLDVNVTNELTNVEAGPEKGTFSVSIYASLTGDVNLGDDTLVTTTLKNTTVGKGKTIRVVVPVKSLPSTLATGNYQLLLETTDSYGNTEVINTGRSVNVIAAVVSLSASFVSVPTNVFKSGATLSLATTGNVIDLSKFTAVIGFSSDSGGHDVVNTAAGIVKPDTVVIRPGKATKVRITGWNALMSTLPSGSFYLTVTLTDANGNIASVVSPTTMSYLT